MPVHAPGPRLFSSIHFKALGGKGAHGRKSVYASLNLTAFVDLMTVLVTFLMMTFSATGEILMSQKGLELPDALSEAELQRVPIITVSQDVIAFNGEDVADPRNILADNSMEFKILELYERLKMEKTAFELSGGSDEDKELVRGKLILQADKTIDAKVINRVMKTAYAAEYPNIMFAVNARTTR